MNSTFNSASEQGPHQVEVAGQVMHRDATGLATTAVHVLEDEAKKRAQEQLAKARREIADGPVPIIAMHDSILERFAVDIEALLRLVGEERNAKLLYLAATSRVLKMPASVLIKGSSSGGKSFLLD